MRTVVSFTTLPLRLPKCKPMIDSILNQSVVPDRIVLALPDHSRRFEYQYTVPDWMPPQIEIMHAGKDLGPAMKLIPALQTEADPETCIITVDDDVIYHPTLIEELQKASASNSKAAFGFMGTVHGNFVHAENTHEPYMVEVLGGYRGVAYRRKHFDDRIFSELEQLNEHGVFLTDDQLFSWHLERNGTWRYVVSSPGNHLKFEFMHLGGGVYEEDGGRKSLDSLERVSRMYGKGMQGIQR